MQSEASMGLLGERAFESVSLATLFGDDRGRRFIADRYPGSVLELYDAVVAHSAWPGATSLSERAVVVAMVLMKRPDTARRFRSDLNAGLLGFGYGDDEEWDAALRDVMDFIRDERYREESRPEADPPPRPRTRGGVPGAGGVGFDRGAVDTNADGVLLPVEHDVAGGVVDTWLNAEVDNKGRPLEAFQKYTLEVYYGEKSDTAQASGRVSVFFAEDDASVDLSVQLVSSSEDFTVPKHPQTLTLARDGTSDGSVLFPIVPLHDGPSTVSVVVDVKGNFLQRLDLTFDVGAESEPEVANYGRTVGAASVLERRAARLEINPAVGGYELHAPQLFPDKHLRILITADELSARIEAVRKVLLAWVGQRDVALKLDVSPDNGDALLRDLAEKGFRLYQAIFRGPDASPSLREVGRWLLESLSADVTTLQVVSTGFPVPWPLVYLTDRFDHEHLSWDNFIGMRHVVEQIRMTQNDVAPPPKTIESTPEMTVRTIYNNGIDEQISDAPVADQRAYWGARGVVVTEGSTADDLMRSALAASAVDKVLYLYCHATASQSDTDESKLTFTGRQSVSLGTLWRSAPDDDKLSSRPLVFLNACESADMSPNFYDGFVPYFEAKGARGVIGTECKIPGLFASKWAQAFFDELFTGKPLGDVVLELRKRFLTQHNNPLGLLYGVHCDTDTVVAPALPRPDMTIHLQGVPYVEDR
jgi:hypothetical protein